MRSKQRGSTLLMSLVFLSLLSSLAVGAAMSSRWTIRMTHALIQHQQAWLSAENILQHKKNQLKSGQTITNKLNTDGTVLIVSGVSGNRYLQATVRYQHANVSLLVPLAS